LQEPTPEALESLAALLTVIGPTFDTQDWAYQTTLNTIFEQVERFTKKVSIGSRVRCLLKDVLDLRRSNWHNMRPKKIEGPLKLEQVAAKAAEENGGWTSQKVTASTDDWSTLLSSKPEKKVAGTTAGQAMLEFLKNRDQQAPAKEEPKATLHFDKQACRADISATLSELRISHDVPEAIVRIASISVPVVEQPRELDNLLASIAAEGSEAVRKAGFDLVSGLFLEAHWKSESVTKGVRSFLDNTSLDLQYDVPNLRLILCEELYPALAPLVTAGFLATEQHGALLNV